MAILEHTACISPPGRTTLPPGRRMIEQEFIA